MTEIVTSGPESGGRPRQDGKIDKGSPATARSGEAERIEPPIGAAFPVS